LLLCNTKQRHLFPLLSSKNQVANKQMSTEHGKTKAMSVEEQYRLKTAASGTAAPTAEVPIEDVPFGKRVQEFIYVGLFALYTAYVLRNTLFDFSNITAKVSLVYTALMLLGTTLVGIATADFVSGVIHWFADTWGTVEWPYVRSSVLRAQFFSLFSFFLVVQFEQERSQTNFFLPRVFLYSCFMHNIDWSILLALFPPTSRRSTRYYSPRLA